MVSYDQALIRTYNHFYVVSFQHSSNIATVDRSLLNPTTRCFSTHKDAVRFASRSGVKFVIDTIKNGTAPEWDDINEMTYIVLGV